MATADILASVDPMTGTAFLSDVAKEDLARRVDAAFDDDAKEVLMSFFKHVRWSDGFVVDLDDVLTTFDFPAKINAIRAMNKRFTEGTDFIIMPERMVVRGGASRGGGGNRTPYMMTMAMFRDMCMSCKTPKGQALRAALLTLESIIRDAVVQACPKDEQSPDAKTRAMSALTQARDQAQAQVHALTRAQALLVDLMV